MKSSTVALVAIIVATLVVGASVQQLWRGISVQQASLVGLALAIVAALAGIRIVSRR